MPGSFAAAIALSLLCTAPTLAAPRSSSEIAAFKRAHPCPATGQARGPCGGYQVDHVNPVCAGGADHRDNMQWLTVQEHRWKTRSDLRMCRLQRKK